LFFALDNDANIPGANSIFTDVELFESPPVSATLSGAAALEALGTLTAGAIAQTISGASDAAAAGALTGAIAQALFSSAADAAAGACAVGPVTLTLSGAAAASAAGDPFVAPWGWAPVTLYFEGVQLNDIWWKGEPARAWMWFEEDEV
jgi:hypothetical protein